MAFADEGHALLRLDPPVAARAELRARIFAEGEAGTRCLLDIPCVRDAAQRIKALLCREACLSARAVAVQAIAFDKTPGANWKVTWHQDLMFPLAERAEAEDYALWCVKNGLPYARPPRTVLESMVAARLHLDDCDSANGPLRVAPGSHRQGVIAGREIETEVARHGERVCLAAEGEVLVMRPLLLHASSVAREPRHRRVLHVVYHDGPSPAVPWHRLI